MNRMRWLMVSAAVVGFMFAGGQIGYAFHESANLICSDCHTMHDSVGRVDQGDTDPQDYLLIRSGDALCLSCHDELLAVDPYTGGTENIAHGGLFGIHPDVMGRHIALMPKALLVASRHQTGT